MKKNRKCKVKINDAFDFKGGTFVQPSGGIEFAFESPGPSYYGNTFTPRAAMELVYQKAKSDIPQLSATYDPTLAIEFGRDSLLRILSQKGCEAIRFAFSKTIDEKGKIIENETSLVAMGLDSTGKLLFADSFKEGFVISEEKAMALTEEKGNKVATSKVLEQMGAPIDKNITYEVFLGTFSNPLF